MPLQWLYEAGSDATYEDITDRVRLYTADFTQNAEEGSVALSRVTIDDPDGDYEIKGYRRIAAYETAASAGSNSLTYNGFIVDRTVTRGPYRTGAGRQWVCSVADTNVVAEFRIMVGSDANRPAETDVQRMQWLMSTSEMSRIPNTTFLNTAGPVAMDAVDYRGQRANDVLNDCAQASGKNHFTFAIDAPDAPLPAAPGATHLWYDFADSTARTSSIRLSNINTDRTGDPYGLTYAIADDTELERDPSRVYSGAYGRFDGGDVFEESIATSNEFTRRDAVVPMENVKTRAKATARALRYLTEMSTEEDRIRTAIRLPAARVNFVREGMRVQFRASHLHGYEDFTYLRVLRRTVKQDSEEEYLVTLELGTGPSVATAVTQTCEGGAYAITPSQHFTPYGSPGTSDSAGIVVYATAAAFYEPKPNYLSNWGFPTYGPPDFAGDCTNSGLHFILVGSGTLVVQTSVGAAGVRKMRVRSLHKIGGIETTHEDYDVDSGATVTVTVPSDDADNCLHAVVLSDGTDSCGRNWGWSGADWTLG